MSGSFRIEWEVAGHFSVVGRVLVSPGSDSLSIRDGRPVGRNTAAVRTLDVGLLLSSEMVSESINVSLGSHKQCPAAKSN